MLYSFNVAKNKIVFVDVQIPESMKIVNVLNLNLLQKSWKKLLTNQVNKLISWVIIKNNTNKKVKDTIDVRNEWCKLEFRIKWVSKDKNKKRYDVVQFENFSEIMENFYSCNPKKARSKKRVIQKMWEKKLQTANFFLIIYLSELTF